MKIKVSKRQLLAQLPDKIRTDLVGANDLPDYFEFDAEEVNNGLEIAERVRKNGEYLEVQKYVTGMQFFMFSILVSVYPQAAPITLLAGKLKGGRYNVSNLVAVHIMNLKKTLKKHDLPFDIEGKRASVLGSGSYRLIKK